MELMDWDAVCPDSHDALALVADDNCDSRNDRVREKTALDI